MLRIFWFLEAFWEYFAGSVILAFALFVARFSLDSHVATIYRRQGSVLGQILTSVERGVLGLELPLVAIGVDIALLRTPPPHIQAPQVVYLIMLKVMLCLLFLHWAAGVLTLEIDHKIKVHNKLLRGIGAAGATYERVEALDFATLLRRTAKPWHRAALVIPGLIALFFSLGLFLGSAHP